MDLHTFMALHEHAQRRRAQELAAIPYPNPLLAHHTFFATVEGLRKDWREIASGRDTGKHKPHRFWVRALDERDGTLFGCARFWPQEVVDDLRIARVGVGGWGFDEPTPVPLGALDDALVRSCPECRVDGPLVGSYLQTRNSIEFDEWTMSFAVLCAGCKAARKVASTSRCERFDHLVLR